jgi:hypothetical protein
MLITIFENYNATDKPHYISVDSVVNRIRSGKSKELCNSIRQEPQKEERNKLKSRLPAICFGGKFTTRSMDGLAEPSGLMTLDFDGFESKEALETKRFEFEMDDYTHICFLSPSGDGLKVVVRIPPADKTSYKQYFKALKEYYNTTYFDNSCSDISRITYESYDENIFVNSQSLVWDKKIEEKPVEQRKVLIPTDDTNKIVIGILSWWNRTHGLVSGKRNHNMFVLASALNEYGVDKTEALSTCLQFVQPDFSEREITTTVESAYRNTALFNTSQWEDRAAVREVERLVAKSVPVETIRAIIPEATEDNINDIKENVSEIDFWYFNKNGGVEFVNHRYRDFLTDNGFYKYYASRDGTFVLVHMEGNIIRQVLDDHIKDFVINYLYNKSDKRIFDAYSGSTKLQKEDFLSFLPNVNNNFMRDTRNYSHIYYKNCAIRIGKDSIEQLDYSDLGGIVWEKNILDRSYVGHTDYSGCEFERFLSNISGGEEGRLNTMRSTLGYMMHRFNDPAYNPAVILNDETISDKPEGGTGKGIFVNSISKVRKTVHINGKNLDPKNRFAYQRVTPDTQVIALQDIEKNFPFDSLFSILTEGMPIEVKNQQEMFIPFQDLAKFIITTNHAIKGDGNSNNRRKWEVEFTQYYSENFTPYHEFGHTLFDDWSEEEWARFDSFMISNVQLYLSKGLIKSKFKNLKVRKFYIATSHEFAEWALGEDKEHALKPDIDYIGQNVMNDFMEKYPDYGQYGKIKLTHRTFYRWLDEYAKFRYGTKLIEKRSAMGKVISFYEEKKQLRIDEFS